jgi:aldehyde dehydrogenase family protein
MPPFGGMKASGIGRDGGDYSFDFYMETKHVSLARGTHKIQRLGIWRRSPLFEQRIFRFAPKDFRCPFRNTCSTRLSTSSAAATPFSTWWI